MSVEDVKTGVAEMMADLSRIQKEHQENLQKRFHEVVKEFFIETPEVRGIVWEQTVPYFNDGEPCVFGVGSIFFTKTEIDFDDLLSPYEYEEDAIHLYSWSKVDQRLAVGYGVSIETLERCRDFVQMVNELEDLVEAVYGSNSRVYLSRDRTVAEEYTDHD